MPNNKLDEIEVKVAEAGIVESITESVEKSPEPPVQDLMDQFDPGRKVRQETLSNVDKVLSQVGKGAKVNQARLLKILLSQQMLSREHERLLCCLMSDIYQITQMHSQSGRVAFNIGSQLKSVITALEEKELVTEEEINTINKERTIPEALKQMQEGAQVKGESQPEEPTGE